jgi:hypothetical protein
MRNGFGIIGATVLSLATLAATAASAEQIWVDQIQGSATARHSGAGRSASALPIGSERFSDMVRQARETLARGIEPNVDLLGKGTSEVKGSRDQFGLGNWIVGSLSGTQNEVTISQTGIQNGVGLFQDASSSSVTAMQAGYGNQMYLTQSGDRLSMNASQTGTNNVMALQQSGTGSVIVAAQSGIANQLGAMQTGSGNRLTAIQR